MAYKPVRITTADAETVQRMQAAVAAEFAALETPSNLGVTLVSSSKSLAVYNVGSSDRYVVANASGGALKVALPAPGNQQVVTVVKADASSNPVTVAIGNGRAMGDGTTAVQVERSESFLCDKSSWWRL